MKEDEEYNEIDERYVNETTKANKKENNKKIFSIIAIIGIIVIVILLVMAVVGKVFKSTREKFGGKVEGFINGVISEMDKRSKEFDEEAEKTGNKIDKSSFNSKFEMCRGTTYKVIIATILDEVDTNNKTNSDRTITVIYNETKTTDTKEIIKIKQSLEQSKPYEVILDYDAEGYVNQITIEDI